MQTARAPEISRDTFIAINKLRQLGFGNIVVVDDTAANTQAAATLKSAVEKSGLKLDLFSGVEKFRAGIKSIKPSGHTLVLTDFTMPCDREFLGYMACGGMAVVDSCLELESKGHINFPIVISHAGKGHAGEIVEICYGNGNIDIGDFKTGKAEPKFWEKAVQEIARLLTEGEAKHLWKIRVTINNSEPYRQSALTEDDLKLGYFPRNIWQNTRRAS